MGIIKKVIEKNIFFGAKAELFTLALQMRKNPTEAEKASGDSAGAGNGCAEEAPAEEPRGA